jgi:integrase
MVGRRSYLADAAAGRLLTRHGRPKKQRTLDADRGRVARHIKPLLGRLPVAAVTHGDIEKFMHDVAAGKTAATVRLSVHGIARVRGGRIAAARTLVLLGAIFTRAVKDGLVADNPVRRVVRFADGKRDRRLTDAEFAALGDALRRGEAEGIWPPALACARFLALTGWRKGEALTLRWDAIDLARRTARLPETKTGGSVRPLSIAACDLLRGLPRIGERVFPPSRGTAPMAFTKHWYQIAKVAGLPADISPHTLRHAFVSVGRDLNYSDSTVGALVGHRTATMTGRYTHHADAVLLAAADAVAGRMAELLGDAKPAGVVVLAHPRRAARAG